MKCVKVMKSIWTKPEFLGDEYSVEIWFRYLKDLTYEQLATAINKHTMTSRFPPTIAELREQLVDIQADKSDWSDGWGEVLTAIRKYGYMNEDDALESMSPMTREVVKRLGWQHICQSEKEGLMALRANFRMAYMQKSKSIKEEMQLPVGFMEKAKALTENNQKMIESEVIKG